jgi:hypothetical protein
MSSRSDVLSVIWSGECRVIVDKEADVFKALLSELFPGKTIFIGVNDDDIPERVLLDDTEVLPFLSLGDVVAEELNVSVPYGTALVFVPLSGLLPTAGAARLGGVIGHVYGQIIIEALHRGGFPMEREMGLLMGLAHSSVSAVERLAAGGRPICRAAFERALAATLYSALSGDGAPSGREATLEELKRRFGTSAVDGLASPPMDQEPLNFEDWLATLVPPSDEGLVAEDNARAVQQLRTSKI